MYSCVTEDGADAFDELFEVALGSVEFATAGGGEAVVFGAASGFGEGPLGGNPATLFHAMEGRIEGTFFDAQQLLGCALNVEDDAVAMQGAGLGKRFKNEQVQGSLEIVFGHGRMDPLRSWYDVRL